MRYFLIRVDHAMTYVDEAKKLKAHHWTCVVDGETVHYQIIKNTKSNIKGWYERGTIEAQYHARNLSRTGVVLWQHMPKNPPQKSKKKAAIEAKMRRLL